MRSTFTFLLLGMVLLLASGDAAAVTLPSTGDGFIDQARDWAQNWIDGVTGPWALAISVLSIAVGIFCWMFAPREGFVGVGMKIFGFCIFMLNIGLVIETLRFS